jgi:hypothetical protein
MLNSQHKRFSSFDPQLTGSSKHASYIAKPRNIKYLRYFSDDGLMHTWVFLYVKRVCCKEEEGLMICDKCTSDESLKY